MQAQVKQRLCKTRTGVLGLRQPSFRIPGSGPHHKPQSCRTRASHQERKPRSFKTPAPLPRKRLLFKIQACPHRKRRLFRIAVCLPRKPRSFRTPVQPQQRHQLFKIPAAQDPRPRLFRTIISSIIARSRSIARRRCITAGSFTRQRSSIHPRRGRPIIGLSTLSFRSPTRSRFA